MKILIAEDDKAYAKMMALFVEREGHETIIVENGLKVLEYINQDNPVDLILIDIYTPRINGMSATMIIQSYLKKEIPIYAITSCREEDMEANKQTFHKIFYKPLVMKELVQSIRELKEQSSL